MPLTTVLGCCGGGPLDRTFAAHAKFGDGRTHTVRTEQTLLFSA